MKKKISVLLLLLIICLGFYSYNMLKYGNFKFFRVEQEYENVNRPNSQTDALSRNPYLVYDRNQGKVLEENNADEVFSTASLAKLFTVLYTLENVDIDFKVRVGDEIYLAGQNSSLAGITEGVYTIRDLIKAAIVPSGNDAAYALAKATLDEVKKRDIPPSELNDVFKAEIQKFLKNNGFDSTHLVDPAGYDEANTSNVNDILKAINKLYTYKSMSEIFNIYYAQIGNDKKESFYLVNINKFMDPNSEFYNKNVLGIKTGTLGDVANIAIRYFDKNNDLIMILSSKNDYDRYNLMKVLMDNYIK